MKTLNCSSTHRTKKIPDHVLISYCSNMKNTSDKIALTMFIHLLKCLHPTIPPRLLIPARIQRAT